MNYSLCDEGFPLVYKRFYKPIRSYIKNKTICGHTADDLTQEVFAKAYRFRENYDSKQPLTTWLWTIAKNTIVDWHRARESRVKIIAISAQDENGEANKVIAHIPCTNPSAENALIKKSEETHFLERLKKLTERQRAIAELRLIEQLKFSEIAKRLNISLSATKNGYQRAKEALSDSTHLAGAKILLV